MKEGGILFVASLLLIGSAFMILLENSYLQNKITGYDTVGTTISNVSISKYLSISMSGNLTAGIQYGTVDTLPATDINATGNNNSAGESSSYFINVSTDSNTRVDFCIKANDHMTNTAGYVIGLDNETYSNSTNTNSSHPLLAEQTALTTGYVKSGSNITIGQGNYYRFWLDIPSGTSSGTYNNTVSFKGVEVTLDCGA